MADDELAAALAEIRAVDSSPALALLSEACRAARKGYAPEFGEEEIDAADNAVTALDLARGRLVAALEAALGAADGWKRFAAEGDAQDECADELRKVIAAALTGKEPGNAVSS